MVTKELKTSLLKYALIAMTVIAIVTFLSWAIGGMSSGNHGALDSYATGEMSVFRTLDEVPAQPDIAYLGGGGEEILLADFRGKVILVNFWATWCGPCVEEMPALSRLQARLGGDDFDVVTISLDASVEDARGFYERMSLDNLPLIHDPSLASPNRVGALGLPMSILYDRLGNEIGRVPAPAEWDSDEAIALIRAAMRNY